MWSCDRPRSRECSPLPCGEGAGMGVRGMRLGSEIIANKRATVRLGIAFSLALLTAGCFQPLYGGPHVVPTEGLDEKLRTVEVLPINLPIGTRPSRVGVEA